ncbi:MAG: hypothetical protein M1337_05280 [Actinobacteria bacterium]|nr:hypothetical protein [Actinomycetota bacterium]
MGKQKTTGGKPKPAPAEWTEARIEALLERFDQALLSGDQTRMSDVTEQLWPIRRHLPEALTKRIIDGRARIPTIAFELLAGFAGHRTKSYLKRIAEDRNVLDIVRFGAQRRMGWPQRGEKKRRLAFLETLNDAEGTLLEAVDQGTEPWPPDGEILAEVLGYLISLPTS